MRKMPPLPNRKTGPNNIPGLQVASNQIKMPHRYNSIERVVREGRDESLEKRQDISITNQQSRQNALIKRPQSARQSSACLSNDSKGSRQSKESLRSREGSSKHRQSPHYSMKMRMSMPSISAHSWVLYEMKEHKFIFGKNSFKRREVASLTKIMNLTTMIKLLQSRDLIPSKIRINVTKEACTLIGTTAELKPSIELSLEDLYYGMMLPSGNDAAFQVAQIGGAIISLIRQGDFDRGTVYNCQKMSQLILKPAVVGLYLHEMNQTARKIGLSRSNWANPHGLSNVNNVSTAEDLAILCMFAMKNTQFREVVSTKIYNCTYYFEKELQNGGSEILKDVLRWQNTNKMLLQGWSGIKTGITPNAGPCLASSVKKLINGRQYEFLIILLKSENMQARWKETRSLSEWIVNDPSYYL